MSRRIHFLKVSPQYFRDVVSGDKMFEIRKDDRGFMLYDTLVLMEYTKEYNPIQDYPNVNPTSNEGRLLKAMREYADGYGFSGNFTVVSVQYILTSKDFPDGIKDGYCVLGLVPGEIDYERDLIPEARRANVEPCVLRHPFPIRHRGIAVTYVITRSVSFDRIVVGTAPDCEGA